MRWARFTVAAIIGWSLAPSARAEPPSWLSVSGACPVSATEVAGRVDAVLVGTRPVATSASIDIADTEAGLRLLIRVQRGDTELGVKTLTVPTCDEALESAVLIVAVAIGEASAPQGVAQTDSPGVVPAPFRPAFRERGATEDRGWISQAGASTSPSVSTVLFGGADLGTLAGPAPYVGAAVALLSMPVELRAAFRYGLRREEASEDSGASERSSNGFTALELSGCRGIGSQPRFTLCAGGELALVQSDRSRSDGDESVDTDERAPRLAGVLAGRAGAQLGGVLMEVELGGFAAAMGPGVSPRAGARAGVGAGVLF